MCTPSFCHLVCTAIKVLSIGFIDCDTKADDKRPKINDQLQLFAEVALLELCNIIYCIFAKVQSFFTTWCRVNSE